MAGQVREAGGRGAAGVGDVCSAADVARLAGEAEVFFGAGGKEGCDVLVTSAGIGRFGMAEEISEADFDATFQVLSHRKSSCRSQLPHKSVNLFFTITNVQKKLTNLYGH